MIFLLKMIIVQEYSIMLQETKLLVPHFIMHIYHLLVKILKEATTIQKLMVNHYFLLVHLKWLALITMVGNQLQHNFAVIIIVAKLYYVLTVLAQMLNQSHYRQQELDDLHIFINNIYHFNYTIYIHIQQTYRKCMIRYKFLKQIQKRIYGNVIQYNMEKIINKISSKIFKIQKLNQQFKVYQINKEQNYRFIVYICIKCEFGLSSIFYDSFWELVWQFKLFLKIKKFEKKIKQRQLRIISENITEQYLNYKYFFYYLNQRND